MLRNVIQIDRTRAVPSQHALEKDSSVIVMKRWENEKFAEGPWNILHSFGLVAGLKESINEKSTLSIKAEDGSAKNGSNL